VNLTEHTKASGCPTPAIGTKFVRASKAEQLRRALPVLLAARRSIIFGEHRDAIDAIQSAGKAGIECHWARQVLQSVVPSASLIAWQADLSIRQSDFTRALDRAIRLCRAPDARRGGWSVSPHAART